MRCRSIDSFKAEAWLGLRPLRKASHTYACGSCSGSNGSNSANSTSDGSSCSSAGTGTGTNSYYQHL
jgi:hypothetical protein